MKHIICGLFLLFATSMVAQRPIHPPSDMPPPYSTPPTFPDDSQTPRRMPPESTVPPAQDEMSNSDIEQQLNKNFKKDAGFANATLRCTVSDQTIELAGAVQTKKQHELAVQSVQAYAGARKIVDRVVVRSRT